MNRRIRDVLAEASHEPAGSEPPGLAQLVRCLEDHGPIVAWLHGPTGAGKSALLARFSQLATDDGARVFTIDCRTLEPTVSGLLAAVDELLGVACAQLEDAAARLSGSGRRVVIAFDNYEVFRLADAWLRRDFIPLLSASARVVLISRESPAAGWVSAREWRDHFLAVPLAGDAAPDARALAARCLSDDTPAGLREALQATSVLRRVTQPMLAALCPGSAAEPLFRQLARLPCVEQRRDGLAIQEALRRVMASELQAADPGRYRDYQRRAWQLLRQQLRTAARADLWRYTADAIYLIENPVIREAFFPSESARYSVEPARPQDRREIMAIVSAHEPPEAGRALELWWTQLPGAFHVVRDMGGAVAGFYCMARPDELDSDWMQLDPVARNWQRHLNRKGRAARAPAIFLRRWLSREDGEAPSAVQAAAWVDIKRSYLEFRPRLRRVYLALRNIAPYGPAATELGFSVLDELVAPCGEAAYHTAMLDFGPGSVDGWICRLLAAELGIVEGQLLDAAARELVLGGRRIALTPLEFNLIALLENRASEAVPRTEILRQVWGHGHAGGSNVVDAVVRGLRRKLASEAHLIETVRGVGYRLAGQFSSNSHAGHATRT